MNKKIFVLAILVLAFLLSACAADAPAPTAAQTEPPALLSTNSQVTYQPTFTITPTQTLRPTSTPYHTPTITPSATPRPTITLPPYPTPELGFSRYPHSISPTGKWIAWEIDWVTGEVEDIRMQFINQEGNKIWSYSYDDLYFNKKGTSGYTKVAFWSLDNKFVYLTTQEIDVEWYFSPPVYAIAKLSLVNGSISYIITPNYIYYENYDSYWPINYSYAFSNNGRWLVYAKKNGQSIDFTLQNLYSGETEYFSIIVEEAAFYGDIVWSPNDKYFVLSADEAPTYIGETDDFSVFLVTLEDLSIKRIYPHGGLVLSFPEWVSNADVKYDYMHLGKNVSGTLILNIETGEITEVATGVGNE